MLLCFSPNHRSSDRSIDDDRLKTLLIDYSRNGVNKTADLFALYGDVLCVAESFTLFKSSVGMMIIFVQWKMIVMMVISALIILCV